MIHAAQFNNGKLTYRNKWVRTQGWLANDAKGEESYFGIHSSLKGREDMPMTDTANTDIIGHAGQAVATWYLAGKAHIIDPLTLETIEAADYGAQGSGQGVSAHPKVDEVTGEMMFFDYFDHEPYMAYGVVDNSGKLVHHVPIELPGNRLPHDMGISENYSILHDLPVYHDEAALAAGQGSLNWATFRESLMGATRTSAMIMLILAGAAFLKLSMGFTGLPRALADGIAAMELSRFQLLMALLVFYIVLGMFLDGISSVVLTMAVVEPMVREAGIDLIWFGIFVVVVVEMAQITPPIGFNLFVLQGMTDHEMGYIAKAALPMFLIMVLMCFVLIWFPELALWLPENLRQGP